MNNSTTTQTPPPAPPATPSPQGQPHSTHEHAHAHADIPKDLPKISSPMIVLAGIVVLAAMIGLFLLGWIPRHRRLAELKKESEAAVDSRPAVDITQPKRDSKPVDLVLPADARSFQETAIFPRANGYLKSQTVDIGDHVKAGQLLAEIDAPDTDAELRQSKAALELSQANLVKSKNDRDLAATTLKRYEGYATSGGVTEQDLDQRRSNLAQAEATYAAGLADVQVQIANVQRLTALQGFEKITAPFDGVITARNFDIGALMSASNNTGRPLLGIAQTDTLRVFVNVPQTYVTTLKPGQEAALSVRNYPGREFKGAISRTAGALDPLTRTLRYEIDFPNKEGLLYAGMYGQARLSISTETPPITVPTSSLVFDASGTKVWVVEGAKAHVRKVTPGRDFGTEMEIDDGLKGTEQVVTNPGSRLAEGIEVLVNSTPSPTAPPPVRQAAAR